MKRSRKFILILSILAGSLMISAPAYAAKGHHAKAEAQQSVEEQGNQSRYQALKKEANAAYRDAVADCKKMRGADRNSCMKEAKANLQNDLADAKKAQSSGQ